MPYADPSVILGAKPIEIPDPENALMRALQIQNLRQQQQQGQIAIEQHQNALTRATGLQNVYQTLPAGSKLEDTAAALTKAGYGDEALKVLDKASGINKDNAQAGQYQAETQLKQMQLVGGITTALASKPNLNVNDVGVLKQQLQTKGINTSDFDTIPPDATPDQLRQFFGQYGQGAMTAAQQYSQKLDQAKFGETQQHDRATERVAQGQLGVSQGHLALSRQAEARQANEANTRATYQTVTDAQGNQTLVALPTKVTAGAPVSGQVVTNPDGTPLIKGVAGGKPPTEAQANAALYGNRAAQSDAILKQLDGQYSPSGVLLENKTSGVPGVAGLVNSTLSDTTQKAAQAQRDFVTAILRKESGASISKTEFDTARAQYFPQAGDSSAVIAQKAQNRATAIAGIKAGAGNMPSAASGPMKISGDADYANLPSGAEFIAPDGTHRRKP